MKINGKVIKLQTDVVLLDFLKEQGFSEKKIAVMKNSEIVPKAEYDKTVLTDADSLEVVSFVGGG